MDSEDLINLTMTATPDRLAKLIEAMEEIEAQQCTVMFCIGDRDHPGDSHYDVTGYSWTAKAPAEPVIAHVYSTGEGNE